MTRRLPYIRGSGGGGKGGGADEAPESLRSRQHARILDALGEGEIVGLVDGLKSVYLNDVQIQADDGTLNFKNVQLSSRVGTQAQPHIPGFEAVESEIPVGVEVKYSASVTRTVLDGNLDAVRVTIGFPQMTKQSRKSGDVDGTTVRLAIDVQTDGGGYVTKVDEEITGKTVSRYQRAYLIPLPADGPWDVRVRRITPDSEQANINNKSFWDSYTAITYAKLSYPNTALVGLRIDAEQFGSIPTRGYDVKGLVIQVPANYDPETREYDGAWNGTFKLAWSDNPAWCFYDLLVSDRYGLGDYLDATQVDKWALYSIGRYCDELVDDGRGGMEPRFTCNLYLQERQEAFSVIQQMSSIFRAITWWQHGTLTAIQDAPADPVALFTAANVINGAFSYEGSSYRQRHTVALVAWNDPRDQYRRQIEYVEDLEGIARWGVRETEIQAIGCTSRGQAHRLGRWMLYSERMETDVARFRAGLDAALVYPGAVIEILDPARAGRRHGGRVVTATTTTITVDAALTLDDGATYRLSCVLADGSIASSAVTNAHGSTSVLTLSPALASAPLPSAIWILTASNLVPTTWRVVDIAETEPGIVEISALAHRPNKYAAVEQDLILEELPYTLAGAAAAPSNLAVLESMALLGPGLVTTKALVSWDLQPGVLRYEVRWRREEDNWTALITDGTSFEIAPIDPGTYEVSVVALNALGRRSKPATLRHYLYGKLAPPADVANLRVSVVSGMAQLAFDAAEDYDVLVGGLMRVRHSSALTGATWASAIDLGVTIPGTATTALLPLLTGTYLAKWSDSSGNESETAASVVTQSGDILLLNVVEEWEAAPGWSGTLVNCEANDNDELQLEEIGGEAALSGTYTSDVGVDLGEVMTARLSASLALVSVDLADTIGARTGMVSSWPLISSLTPGNTLLGTATPHVRTSDDGAAWSAWQPLVAGDYTAKEFEFRLVLSSPASTVNVAVSSFAVSIDMPDLVQTGSQIVSGAATYSVAFARTFHAIKALAITPANMATGDYYTITNRATAGFDITFYDAGNSAISRTFDYIAQGY